MKIKIAFTGSHGLGKSTAAFHLANLVKTSNPGLSVKVLEENVREISRMFDNKLNHTQFQKYCIVDQIHREMEAENLYDVIICDRTAFDPLIYAQYFDVEVPTEYTYLAEEHLKSYSHVFQVVSDGSSTLYSDGFRMTNLADRDNISLYFERMLKGSTKVAQSKILSYDYLKHIERLKK